MERGVARGVGNYQSGTWGGPRSRELSEFHARFTYILFYSIRVRNENEGIFERNGAKNSRKPIKSLA